MAKASSKPEQKQGTKTAEIRSRVLSFMRKGKEYGSRDIVLGIGRTPGATQGGPVIRVLHSLVEEGLVKYSANEGKRGFRWVKK